MAKYNSSEAEMLKAFDDFWSEEDLTRAIENLITAGEYKSMDNKHTPIRDIKDTIETGDLIIPNKYCFDENHKLYTPENYPKDKLGQPEIFTVVKYEGGYGIVDFTDNSLLDSYDYFSDNGTDIGGWKSTEEAVQVTCDRAFGNDNYVIIKKYTIDYFLPTLLSRLGL